MVDAWSWGALHVVVAAAGVFPEVVWGPMRFNESGYLSATDVARLAAFLDGVVLPSLREGERLQLDGSVTGEPDEGTIRHRECDAWQDYSLPHDVLGRVVTFLRSASGPIELH
jgi:hypothetical protein